MDFRSFYKPAGTNPEIKSPFYELSSWAKIEGHFNCEVLALDSIRGKNAQGSIFRPIDPTKPIVLAIDNQQQFGFIVIDRHLKEYAEAGMQNYQMYKTDDYIIDCGRGDYSGCGNQFWSVTSQGMVFVYGKVSFPGTWQLSDADLLCAFIADELTANQLRMHAYLREREAVKEARREVRIRTMTGNLGDALREACMTKVALRQANEANMALRATKEEFDQLKSRLVALTGGLWSFVSKKALHKAITRKPN